jgi:hypothetical protein
MRLPLRNVRPVAIALSLAFALSCRGDAVTDPTQNPTNDTPDGGNQNPTSPSTPSTPTSTSNDQLVANYLAELAGGQSAVGQSATAGAGAGAGVAAGRKAPLATTVSGGKALYAEGPAACTRDTVNTRFNCPAVQQGPNLSFKAWFQLLDKDSKPTLIMDTAVVVAIRRVTTKTGWQSQPGPNGTTTIDTVDNADDMILTNLKDTNHVVNGTGTMNVVIVPAVNPVGHATATTTTKDLVLAKNGTSFYPIAGTVTAIVTSQTTGFPPNTTTQVTTYDGTKIAKLTITLPNGKKTVCTWDMTAVNVAPVCVGPS